MNATTTSNPSTEAQAGAMLAAKPEIKDVNGACVLVTPDGQFKIIESLMTKPVRKTGFVAMRHIESFINFAKNHKTDGSEIRVSAEGDVGAMLILDADGFSEWGATYAPVLSQSFKDWTSRSGIKLGQEEFALFLEQHIDDIHSTEGMPSAGDLLTFCSAIEDKRQVTFKKSVSLQDGRVDLVFSEKASDAQEQRLNLFREFQLALRPFLDRKSTYAVTASLRFRIRDGEITFWYELKGLEAITEKIRSEIKTELEASGLPVYMANF